jgi:NADH-quinone oxidoreductase subunit E
MPRRQPVAAPVLDQAPDTELDLSPIAAMVAGVSDPDANLIAVLQRVQGHYGYLPEPVVDEIARRAGVPQSRLYGVITFYAQFSTEPSGRHRVCVCQGTACHVRGGQGVLRAAENNLGIRAGSTSDDMLYTLETVACLGACSLAPVMTVDGQYYARLTPGRVATTLEQMAIDGDGDDDD